MSRKLFSVVIAVLAVATVGILFFNKSIFSPPSISQQIMPLAPQGVSSTTLVGQAHGACLSNNEFATSTISQNPRGDGIATIDIKDKITGKKTGSIQINIIDPQHYHPLEIHECGIYASRDFDYDFKNHKPLPTYKAEIWKYGYDGQGKSILLLGDMQEGLYASKYSNDFRIDLNEKYIVLERSYLGKPDYAMVVKEINTQKDVLVLNLVDVIKNHPDIQPGSFDLAEWIEDGKYLYGDIYDGAYESAYYWINSENWSIEIYATPPDLNSGVERLLNFHNWHMAYTDIPTFTGIKEVTDQIIKEAEEQGKMKNLFLYNLKTKEKIKISSTSPRKRFDIKWLSDTVLQYTLPSGATTTYTIPQ